MILRVQHLSKSFGGLKALSDVSFELQSGTICGVIGPNGAGKTTLFNAISGVFAPDEGRIEFQGRDITGYPPYRVARLGLARTHQVVRPLKDLTVRDNTMVGACFGRRRLSGAAAARKADAVLEQVGLAPHADQLAGSLNLAEKKRLELARALAADPHGLLLDEVLAGLNATEVANILETIRSIRQSGVGILMIEHVMQAVMKISDAVLVLESGAVIAQGSAAEIAVDPRVIQAYFGNADIAKAILS